MNEELINEVLTRLDGIGAELSKGAAFGYEVLVRQQIIEGIVNLLVATLILVTVVGVSVYLRRSFKDFVAKKEGNGKPGDRYMRYSMEDWALPRLAPAGIVGIFIIPMGVICLVEGIQKLLNPHYYAIYEILERIPG